MSLLENIEYVVKNADSVRINYDKIRCIVDYMHTFRMKYWLEECPVKLDDLTREDTISFLFVFNAISFCYWPTPKWTSGYNRGTWSMINSLKKAIDNGVPVLKQNFLVNIEEKTLTDILKGNTQIPLLKERVKILTELGRAKHSFKDIIRESDYDATRLVDFLISTFPSFSDESVYKGRRILFNKRAQLLASDLGHFIGLSNLDELTCCADYILPMVLQHKGVLEYSQELSDQVNNQIDVPKNSRQEVEIRANTVWAVYIIAKNAGTTPMRVNDYLWIEGNNIPYHIEHHRTLTTSY